MTLTETIAAARDGSIGVWTRRTTAYVILPEPDDRRLPVSLKQLAALAAAYPSKFKD